MLSSLHCDVTSSGLKSHHCNLCGLTFNQEAALTSHQLHGSCTTPLIPTINVASLNSIDQCLVTITQHTPIIHEGPSPIAINTDSFVQQSSTYNLFYEPFTPIKSDFPEFDNASDVEIDLQEIDVVEDDLLESFGRQNEQPIKFEHEQTVDEDEEDKLHYLFASSTKLPKLSKLQCSICNEVFRKDVNLTQHMRLHSGERPFPCKKCTKTFITSSSLNMHVKTNHGNKPFKCNHCDLKFAFQFQLNQHFNYKHAKMRTYRCSMCKSGYNDKKQFETHLKNKHNVETKPAENVRPSEFTCHLCNAKFSTDKSLTIHFARSHESTVKPSNKLACSQCNKKFLTKKLLDEHTFRIHFNYFPCEECQIAFDTKSELNRHNSLMHGPKFCCVHCDRVFSAKRSLVAHMKSHPITGFKVHIDDNCHLDRDEPTARSRWCPFCGERFDVEKELQRHELSHYHSKDPLWFDLCLPDSTTIDPKSSPNVFDSVSLVDIDDNILSFIRRHLKSSRRYLL